MSFEPPSTKPRLGILRVFVFAAIVLSVTGLQVVLPWAFYPGEDQGIEKPGKLNDSWYGQLRDLLPIKEFEHLSFLSGTVFDDDLVMLVKREFSRTSFYFPFYWPVQSHEILRWNLRTNRMTTFPAPEFVNHVVADREKLWLPDDQPFNLRESIPFVIDGQPVGIINSKSDGLFQLSKFKDGNWKESDTYVLLPVGFTIGENVIYQQGENIFLLVYDADDKGTYYRTGLPCGTELDAMEFAKKYPWRLSNLSATELEEIGWKRARTRSIDPSNRYAPFWREPFGFWFEESHPCAIGVDLDEQETLGFLWCRYQAEDAIESKRIESPIRWPQDARQIIGGGWFWFKVITSADNNIFVVAYNDDGRLHVLKWDNGQLKLVAQRGSPMIYREIFDSGIFVTLTILIPMLILGLFTWAIERFQGGTEIRFASESTVLASGTRRGFARFIDCSIPLMLVAISIISHPDAIGWWVQIKSVRFFAGSSLYLFVVDPAWDSIKDMQRDTGKLVTEALSAPFLWYFAVPAILFYFVQIIQQARTGRTFGKWLMGVKVLRTTLRPCGLARSVLREILFLLDSAMLISWVPGVISILATSRSQRIGDLLADTIVVRDSSPNTNARNKTASPPL